MSALAAPPPARVPAPVAPLHLDLRAPPWHASVVPAGLGVAARAGSEGSDREEHLGPPGFTLPDRPTNRIDAAVRNFRREGLPLAHLWQNPRGALSLGLNSRGKPGLWWVQKTH